MSVNLPLDTRLPVQYRFLHTTIWPTSSWDELPSMEINGGFILDEFSRRCLPNFGHLTFHFNFGSFNGRSYGLQQASQAIDEEALNLAGEIIRLQVAPGSDDPSATPAWATVFIGVVEQQETTLAPGADSPLGKRTYYCQDLFSSYARKMRLDHSAFYTIDSSGTARFYPYSFGHPGFNSRDSSGRLLGNMSPSGKTLKDLVPALRLALPWTQDFWPGSGDYDDYLGSIKFHTFTGAGEGTETAREWTDLDVLEHAFGMGRRPFSPWFEVTGGTDTLGTANAWDIDALTTAWDLATQICDRRRGRGVAFFDWICGSETDLSAEIATYIRLNSQFKADLSWTSPVSGAANSYAGAATNLTTKAVDLQGDPRNVAKMFALGDESQSRYDYVEVCGEPIQVLATLDYASGSLAKRWSTTEETAYTAATDKERATNKYDTVYQLHGPPTTWDLTGGDGGVGTLAGERVDYRCSDAGAIVCPAAGIPDSSPSLIRVLGDLPLFVGYDYQTDAVTRYDASTETLAPSRRPPLLLIRQSLSETDRYFRGEGDPYPCQMHISPYGISVAYGQDIAYQTRLFSGVAARGGALTQAYLAITVGLELPHRIRVAGGNADAALGKKLLIPLRGYGLWLAQAGAIWELSDNVHANPDYTGKRQAAGGAPGVPGLLRDDRDRLAGVAALAFSWYLNTRRSATWALRDCGFLPSFTTLDPGDGITSTTITYPTLGQLVTTLTAAGQAFAVNTPITDIVYTATGNGLTTWSTDWHDLNLR